MSRYDLCIVGGGGRAGFPLSVLLASRGVKVVIYDKNRETVSEIKKGRPPFQEKDTEELLRHTLNQTLAVSENASVIGESENVILCIDTPSAGKIDPEQTAVARCVNEIEEHLFAPQCLIIRSTVTPGTTQHLQNRMEEKGVSVCYCPERIAEGNAIQELISLPQIIAAFTEESYRTCERIFSCAAKETLRVPPLEAELVKLFNNSWRYLKFAVANEFYEISSEAGADFQTITTAMRHHYPRARDFPTAGFTAGPCLYKDTQHLNIYHPSPLLEAAIETNQNVPEFVVRQIEKKYDITTLTVGILGMAYKGNVDDYRESLAYRLKDLLIQAGAKVLVSDVFRKEEGWINKYQLINESDLILIGCPHEEYKVLDLEGKPVIDLWEIA